MNDKPPTLLTNPMIDDFDRKLKGLIFSLREMADDFSLSPHGRGRAHRIREAIELLDSFNVMHQERDRLQMRLKRHEPVSHYNGRDIDWWKARAEQAWAALRHLLSHADRPRKELLWCTSAVEEADRALSGDSPCADEPTVIERDALPGGWAHPGKKNCLGRAKDGGDCVLPIQHEGECCSVRTTAQHSPER